MKKIEDFLKQFPGPAVVHRPRLGALEILKYIGPGLIVTIGFIDPGNWASNIAAGSTYGYTLLWMVTLSTLMLIMLQHNVAHLGIATGRCLAESATLHLKRRVSRIVLFTALGAAISTALAELLGAAIGLTMLFHIPLKGGVILVSLFVGWLLFGNGYRKLEKILIGFVSLVGLSFAYEMLLVKLDPGKIVSGWCIPSIPEGSMIIIMSVLGAVVMPHNLFLHSEIIQSRQWNLENQELIDRQLKFEFIDTLLSMLIGWAINSAMIILAAATFYAAGTHVAELQQAQAILRPLLGDRAAIVFAVALLCAGISSCVTAGMAGGTISAGLSGESYDIRDWHTKLGVAVTVIGALLISFFIRDIFQGLIISQMLLSVQLPITIFTQIYLTSSPKVMGTYANTAREKMLLWSIALIITLLNVMLLWSLLK